MAVAEGLEAGHGLFETTSGLIEPTADQVRLAQAGQAFGRAAAVIQLAVERQPLLEELPGARQVALRPLDLGRRLPGVRLRAPAFRVGRGQRLQQPLHLRHPGARLGVVQPAAADGADLDGGGEGRVPILSGDDLLAGGQRLVVAAQVAQDAAGLQQERPAPWVVGREQPQGVLVIVQRLCVGIEPGGPAGGQRQVGQRLLPVAGLLRVVRQLFDDRLQAARVQPLQRSHHLTVQDGALRAGRVIEHAADFVVGEVVAGGYGLGIGDCGLLDQSPPQILSHSVVHSVRIPAGDGAQERAPKWSAVDGRRHEQVLRGFGQPAHPLEHHALHAGRQRRQRGAVPLPATDFPTQCALLAEAVHRLDQEQRIALALAIEIVA